MAPFRGGAGRALLLSLTSLRSNKTSTIRSAPTLALASVFAERVMAFRGLYRLFT